MPVTSTLDRCPRCRYRLTGLPDVHTGADCGIEYDKRIAVVMLTIGALAGTLPIAIRPVVRFALMPLSPFLGVRRDIPPTMR